MRCLQHYAESNETTENADLDNLCIKDEGPYEHCISQNKKKQCYETLDSF